MENIKNIVNKLKNIPKVKYIAILLIIVLAVTISFPTLANYKNRLDLETILKNSEDWDGTIATDYKKGSGKENDPYIISNAKEFAFFAQKLENETYADTYFKLSNDIIINKGTFNYTDNKITYKLDNSTMYIKEYTSEVYATEEMAGTAISTINTFASLKNFEGHLDGDYYRIYGLYMTDEDATELGLFTNLSGTVENIYLENMLIYGGARTATVSSTKNATLKNIFVEGNIVGTKNTAENTDIYEITDYNNTKSITTFTDSLTLPILNYQTIKSLKLTGTYSSTEETQVMKINNIEITPGDFNLTLPITTTQLNITIADEVASGFSLTNMNYEVVYNKGIASGVVAKALDTKLRNIINKASIYSIDEASGLVGIATNITLKNAYNTGKVTGVTNSSGIINSIKNSDTEVIITKAYNSGTLTAPTTYSYISDISNNQTVILENIFNTVTTTSQLTTTQAVTLTNVLDVNESTITEITTKELDEIREKTNLTETLKFVEYVDTPYLETEKEAVWIFEPNYLPILYFDDLNDPIAVLNVGTYNWEDISYEVKDIYLSSDTAFKISPKEANETITASYYLHRDKSVLTKEQLDSITTWTEYTDIVSLKEEGYYIIYVKAKDSDGNIKYINSEQLILDLKAPSATITMNDKSWTSYSEDLTNINISDKSNLTVTVEDTYSEVSETKYYVSNILLTEEELKQLEDDKWTDYEDSIAITEKGTYVVNIKTTDTLDHTGYYNTDYIVFGGFEEKISLGRNNITSETLNVTNNSTITYNMTYKTQTSYQEGYTNNLITSVSLPENTKITLINNNTKETYSYKVDSNKTIYPLNLFTKLGQTDTTKVFDDKKFVNEETKDISFVFDFTNAEITEKLTFNAYLEIHDSNDKTILSTLKSTIKDVNVYPNIAPTLNISTSNELGTINYNSDSITNIELETYLSYGTTNEQEIYDSSLENKKMGIAIKLVNSSDEIIAKNNLKNISFIIGENYYTPDNDGIVRINLSNNLNKLTSTLTITTHTTETGLETGDYNLVITPFIAEDGKYTTDLSSESLSIPVTTTKKDEVNYGFKVTMDSDDKVVYKKDETATLNFQIREKSTFKNSTIRVSLYKKKSFTAYNQEYEVVDLQEYVTDTLTKAEDNIYYVTSNTLDLSLNTTKLEKTGYELRFELYDGTEQITMIKKKFIVR